VCRFGLQLNQVLKMDNKSLADNLLFALQNQSEAVRMFNSGLTFSESKELIRMISDENESNQDEY
jgi:hypothetical protein